MNTWKAILATLVIFGAGVFTGGALVSYFRPASQPSDRGSANVQRPGAPRGDSKLPASLNARFNKEFLDRLDRELKLTSQQREHIQRILEAGQLETKVCWDKIAPDVRAAMVETKNKIRDELTPEQQNRCSELWKHRPAPSHDRSPTNAPPGA